MQIDFPNCIYWIDASLSVRRTESCCYLDREERKECTTRYIGPNLRFYFWTSFVRAWMDKERQEKEEEERKKGIAVPIPLDHRNQSPLLFLRARSRSRTAVHLKLWRALQARDLVRVIRVRHCDTIKGNFESNLS